MRWIGGPNEMIVVEVGSLRQSLYDMIKVSHAIESERKASYLKGSAVHVAKCLCVHASLHSGLLDLKIMSAAINDPHTVFLSDTFIPCSSVPVNN
jgi:hypothetical protein